MKIVFNLKKDQIYSMRSTIAFLILVLFSINTFAAGSCRHLFLTSATSVIFETPHLRTLVLDNVEVFRRNNNIGQQQVGSLRLKKWFEVPPYNQGYYNFVGIADDGKVYHAIDWEGQRRLARVLSGQRSFEQLVIVNGETLLAVDSEGTVFMYSPQVWRKSPRNKLVGQSLMLGSTLLGVLASGLSSISTEYLDPQVFPLTVGAAGVVSYMQAGFWALFRYEKWNTFPDGFVPTPWKIENLSELEGLAKDIVRMSDMQKISLAEDLAPPEHTNYPTPHAEATEDIR